MSQAITFALISQGFTDACVGPYSCDRIEMSREHFTQFIDLMLQPDFDPVKRELVLNEKQQALRQALLDGRQPLRFRTATLMDTPDMGDAIRFVNIARPDQTHTVTLEGE